MPVIPALWEIEAGGSAKVGILKPAKMVELYLYKNTKILSRWDYQAWWWAPVIPPT